MIHPNIVVLLAHGIQCPSYDNYIIFWPVADSAIGPTFFILLVHQIYVVQVAKSTRVSVTESFEESLKLFVTTSLAAWMFVGSLIWEDRFWRLCEIIIGFVCVLHCCTALKSGLFGAIEYCEHWVQERNDAWEQIAEQLFRNRHVSTATTRAIKNSRKYLSYYHN